jgi:hypothetical protein
MVRVSPLGQFHTIEYPKYCSLLVIPAKAGIQTWSENLWTPAFAGVTEQLFGHSIEWSGTSSAIAQLPSIQAERKLSLQVLDGDIIRHPG